MLFPAEKETECVSARFRKRPTRCKLFYISCTFTPDYLHFPGAIRHGLQEIARSCGRCCCFGRRCERTTTKTTTMTTTTWRKKRMTTHYRRMVDLPFATCLLAYTPHDRNMRMETPRNTVQRPATKYPDRYHDARITIISARLEFSRKRSRFEGEIGSHNRHLSIRKERIDSRCCCFVGGNFIGTAFWETVRRMVGIAFLLMFGFFSLAF